MRLALKILVMFGLTLALLVPLGMIRGTVHDRQQYRDQAVADVARSTAGAQALAGPVLMAEYADRRTVREVDARGVARAVEQAREGYLLFFPRTLDVAGTMRPVPRMRGLHEVRVYELQTAMRADFRVTLPPPADDETRRTYRRPRIVIAIDDPRGLVGQPALRVEGRPYALAQGLGPGHGRGLHASIPPPPPVGTAWKFRVEFDGTLQGTETLSVQPLADHNTIRIDSGWPHPRFHGDFLPRRRSVGSQGFEARWDISSLATRAQAQFRSALGRAESPEPVEAVSISLVDPVNVYSQVDRATKYGVLFVLLTFVTFFAFETLRQLRVHPIQYGLVGLALSIFFLLLLALSERIPFALAYVVAAIACVGLIGHYLAHVLGGWRRGVGFAAMLGSLYGALYGLLVSEDNALVLGAGLLFFVLAAIMVATRKVDWYRAAATQNGLA